MLRGGQLGPQGLEDLPMAVMAFMAGVGVIIVFISISSGHFDFSREDDMHAAGKRLVETLSSELFRTDESGSYGGHAIDWQAVEQMHASNPLLKDAAGSVEYAFSARITAGSGSFSFGEEPPENALSYGGAVSVLRSGRIYNGEVIVRIWPR